MTKLERERLRELQEVLDSITVGPAEPEFCPADHVRTDSRLKGVHLQMDNHFKPVGTIDLDWKVPDGVAVLNRRKSRADDN